MKTIVGISEELNSNQLSKLDSFVMLYNSISHRLYVDMFIKKLNINDLSPAYQNKYLINKRHFNSIRLILQGKVASILALNKSYIAETKDKIKAVEKALKTQSKNYLSYKNNKDKIADQSLSLIFVNKQLKISLHNKIRYNHLRLSRLKSKLKRLELIKETGNARLCFGSNKLFRQQFQINNKNNLTEFKKHSDWSKEFHYQRNKEFTLVGSKDETAGNLNAQISHVTDNLFNLKLNLHHNAEKITDKYTDIQFTLNHEVNTLKQIIINNQSKNKDLWQALTYKIIKQNSKHNKNRYVVSISFEKNLIKAILTSKDKGCIGVDINQDHLAVSNLDNKGNLLNIYKFSYNLNGSKHQNNNDISLAVKDLIAVAVKLNKPIVIEELDFTQKKRGLIAGIRKSRNKQLSSFSYSKIIELIKARAEDNFIEVKEVNPAYTSIIGTIKYSKRSRISTHHSAAMCIARKGLFRRVVNNNIKEYVERRISSKNRYIKTSDLPVRNNLKLSIYWKELKENIVKNQQNERKGSIKSAKYSTSLGNGVMPISAMNVSFETLP